MHINGRYKNTLVLGEEPTQGSDNATITAKAKYSVSFTESGKQFVFFYLLLWRICINLKQKIQK